MKMGWFEKSLVNMIARTRRVSEHAETMVRRAGFKTGQTYLDFGCGNGAAATYLAAKLGLEVTGIDVDPEQIAAAKALSAGTPGARFLTVDGTQLPFRDREFDFVATYLVTHHIANWPRALAEMHRVLKPAGYLIYTDFIVPGWIAAAGKRVFIGMGFPIALELERFAQERRLVAAHRARTFNKYEVIWQKPAP